MSLDKIIEYAINKHIPDINTVNLNIKKNEVRENLNNNYLPKFMYLEKKINNRLVYTVADIDLKIYLSILSKYLSQKLNRGHATRNVLIKNISSTLEFEKPNFVYSFDIKNFYTSIDKDKLFDIIKRKTNRSEIILLLERVLDSFSNGILPGISVSNIFAEYYANELVESIKQKFYAEKIFRYVDDFLITSQDNINTKDFEVEIKLIVKEYNLEVHRKNYKQFRNSYEYDFLFLGYKFSRYNNNFSIDISDKKIDGYIKEIDKFIGDYSDSIQKYNNDLEKLKMADSLFFERIKYISSIKLYKKNNSMYEAGIFCELKLVTPNVIDIGSNNKRNIKEVIMERFELDSIPEFTVAEVGYSRQKRAADTANSIIKLLEKGSRKKIIFVNRNNYFNEIRIRKKIFKLTNKHTSKNHTYTTLVMTYSKIIKK